MENVWALAAIWVGQAMIATLLAIWLTISTALTEIGVTIAVSDPRSRRIAIFRRKKRLGRRPHRPSPYGSSFPPSVAGRDLLHLNDVDRSDFWHDLRALWIEPRRDQ